MHWRIAAWNLEMNIKRISKNLRNLVCFVNAVPYRVEMLFWVGPYA